MRMHYYSHDELAQIVTAQADKLSMALTHDGALEIASRSRGTPRVAGRLLRRVRDFASVDGVVDITADVADKALIMLDVDKMGLDGMDRRYLTTLAEHYGGGPVGVDTLAAVLSEQRDMLEEVIEPYLMQTGLLMRTPRGRCLARSGWSYIGMTPPPGSALSLLIFYRIPRKAETNEQKASVICVMAVILPDRAGWRDIQA